VFTCPWHIFIQTKNELVPEIAHEDVCVSCGHCVAVCPTGAIMHTDVPQGSIQPTNQNRIPSIEQISEMLRTRRSVRAFTDTPVAKERVTQIIDGARFAPSTNNVQSTEFVVVQNKAMIKTILEITTQHLVKTVRHLRNPITRTIFRIVDSEKAASLLNRLSEYELVVNEVNNGNDLILHNAPLLLFFHGDKNIGFADVNATLALQNASLVAQGLDLGCFYAGYVAAVCKQDNSIQKLLDIPNNHQIYGCLAIGHPRFPYNNWIEREPPKIRWL
jgi:nitroreductase